MSPEPSSTKWRVVIRWYSPLNIHSWHQTAETQAPAHYGARLTPPANECKKHQSRAVKPGSVSIIHDRQTDRQKEAESLLTSCRPGPPSTGPRRPPWRGAGWPRAGCCRPSCPGRCSWRWRTTACRRAPPLVLHDLRSDAGEGRGKTETTSTTTSTTTTRGVQHHSVVWGKINPLADKHLNTPAHAIFKKIIFTTLYSAGRNLRRWARLFTKFWRVLI